jgi:hypothetical protein
MKNALVIGGRQDLPGFQEQHLRKTFGEWYAHVDFVFVTDAGHYPMLETPIYLAMLIEGFLDNHRGEGRVEPNTVPLPDAQKADDVRTYISS